MNIINSGGGCRYTPYTPPPGYGPAIIIIILSEYNTEFWEQSYSDNRGLTVASKITDMANVMTFDPTMHVQ